jgi:hypothetical protein
MKANISSVPIKEGFPDHNHTVSQLGVAAGLFLSLFVLLFAVASYITGLRALQIGWQGFQAYASSYQIITLMPFVPGILSIPSFVILMTCVYLSCDQRQKPWGLLGLVFSTVYATIIAINYFTQVTLVPQSILTNNLEGLSLYVMGSPFSLFSTLECSGYFFMGLATLFASSVFRGSKLGNGIRWLFIANGFLGLLNVIAVALNQKHLLWISSIGWVLVFITAPIMVSLWFRQLERGD